MLRVGISVCLFLKEDDVVNCFDNLVTNPLQYFGATFIKYNTHKDFISSREAVVPVPNVQK